MSSLIDNVSGRYHGRKHLYLNWLPQPEHISDSSVLVQRVGHAQALQLNYDWSHEGRPHHGALLLVLDPRNNRASGAWVDSWHQDKSVLVLNGSWDEQRIDVLGHYSVEGSADWGWRMLLYREDQQLRLDMFNREPGGEDDPAVQLRWQAAA